MHQSAARHQGPHPDIKPQSISQLHSSSMAMPQSKGNPSQELRSCGGPWGALQSPPPTLLACPVLPRYHLLPPPLRLLTPMVSDAQQLSGAWEPLQAWGAAASPTPTPVCPQVPPPCAVPTGLCPPCCQQPLPAEPGRVKAGAARESSAALKAWLARHPRNPYPSKGEKVMLAVLSHMSLTQVSTWFANARRRLKKENRAGWATRGTEDSEETLSQPPPSPQQIGSGSSPIGVTGPGKGEQLHKPKIWSLAAMVAPGPEESGGDRGRNGAGVGQE